MTMRARALIATAAAAVVLGGASAAAAIAATSAPAPAGQPLGNWVYACVNAAGGVGYLEFREPLPHACNAGLSLWRWPAVIPPKPWPSPTATPTG